MIIVLLLSEWEIAAKSFNFNILTFYIEKQMLSTKAILFAKCTKCTKLKIARSNINPFLPHEAKKALFRIILHP